MSANPFAARLLDWYMQNKRDLPWRGSTDPYKIWLSEVILQQTRVDQGMPYFEKFLRLFPDVHSLASAREDEVLKAWEGLGYYSRARNLHKAARLVSEEFNGIFPKDANGLMSLPGVGPYTSAAIASICYGEKVPVVDGNVNRFVSRQLGLEVPVDSSLGRKAILEFLDFAIAKVTSAGDFNQALMEFGARHCVPRDPDCEHCVFRRSCEARKYDSVARLPLKRTKVKVKDRFFTYHVLIREGQTYVRRRKAGDIWQGLYEFILEESPKKETTFRSVIDARTLKTPIIRSYTHILSHQRIHAQFLIYMIEEQPSDGDLVAISLDELDSLAMARVSTRFLEENIQIINQLVHS